MLSGKTHEIRTIYDNNNLANSPFGDATTGVALELEAKFGFYGRNGFNSNVPYVHFERLLNLLRVRVGNEIIEESLIKSILNDLELCIHVPERIILEKILETKDPDIKKLLWLQYEQLNNEKKY